ncbi:hypothetical protein [Streptomyces cylindrosporus]|uniref:Serine/threonine protein kinase n=1 Tax=Streptomyces cylindrosporus TaxID=2927583 RepID=A0ABS9Y6R7_9ACTN|nr:hypothetical protein [Streptomyces cylindrosporus]MCI3272215.1 hypothetical protein [Streptomyces cylindrosporus]
MSQYDPPGMPGPPQPDPDHLLARRSVRWTIIGVVLSTALALIGLFVQASQSGGGTSAGGTSGGSSGGNSGDSTAGSGDTGVTGGTATTVGPSESVDSADDGLTSAERSLRDSLNSSQWQRESCEHWTAPDATAALRCTVSTLGGTTKAKIATYPSKSEVQEVYLRYTARLAEGNCDTTQNARGTWHENDTSTPAGDMACYWAGAGQYTIFCTYYDRPALFEVDGNDPAALTDWWHTVDPVFTSSTG